MEYDFSGWPFALILMLYWFLGPNHIRRMHKLLKQEKYEEFFSKINREKKWYPLADKKDLLHLEGLGYYYIGEFKQAINVFSKIKIERMGISLYKKTYLFWLLALYFDNQIEQYLFLYKAKDKELFNARGHRQVNKELQILKAIKMIIEDDLEAGHKLLSQLLSSPAPFNDKHIIENYCMGLLYEKMGENKLALKHFYYVLEFSSKYTYQRKIAEEKVEFLTKREE